MPSYLESLPVRSLMPETHYIGPERQLLIDYSHISARRTFLLLSLLLGTATQSQAGAYFLRDYQYFRPLVADIRTTQNHMRFTWDEALPFTDEDDPDSSHLYWDVGFAEYFPQRWA